MDLGAKQSVGEPNIPRLLNAHKLCRENPNLALIEYKALAEIGSRSAMVHLGHGFEYGKYWTTDEREAERWYRLATDRGSLLGQYSLASYYLHQKRYDEALSEFRLGAAREYGPALHLLGRMYYFGTGVTRDPVKAKSYLERASKKGNLLARALLSRLLQRDGHGLLDWIKGTVMKWVTVIEGIIVILAEGRSSERLK